MITAELNTALTEDELSSVPPEVSFTTTTDEDEAEDCFYAHQQALARGNAGVKDRIRLAVCLYNYLVEYHPRRESRDATTGRLTGSERSNPDWVTRQQKYC